MYCHVSICPFLLFLCPDPKSSGHLFYEYVRIKNCLEALSQTNGTEFFWLFENTAHMEHKSREAISKYSTYKLILDIEDFIRKLS